MVSTSVLISDKLKCNSLIPYLVQMNTKLGCIKSEKITLYTNVYKLYTDCIHTCKCMQIDWSWMAGREKVMSINMESDPCPV